MKKIDISTSIIIRIILVILAIWFLYVIRDILVLLFVAIVLVSAIEPFINYLQKKKIPRSLGVLLIYFALFLLIGCLIYFLIPSIQEQFYDFSKNSSEYIKKIRSPFQVIENIFQTTNTGSIGDGFMANFEKGLSNFSSSLFSTTFGIFSGFISLIAILSLTFYMSVKEDGFEKFLRMVIPGRYQGYAISLMKRIKLKIGKWMQGQIILMFLIFALDFLGLTLLEIPYALVLAIFAGIMEIIPYAGPIISAVPGVILGFMISPWVGMLTLLMYILVQQFENHIIIPQVMKKAVGLNPIVVILSLFIGAKLAGVLGAILAIPVATAISVFIGDLIKDKESKLEEN
jgi:predicted PurR-regulated permease PerM